MRTVKALGATICAGLIAVAGAAPAMAADPVSELSNIGQKVLDHVDGIVSSDNSSDVNQDAKKDKVPAKTAARTTQFLWPTIAGNCLAGQGNSIGTAIAVEGPSAIPFPGAKNDETVFLFTALGTGKAAKKQGEMVVDWINLDNLKWGSTPLKYNGVNPEGPTTLSATAKTGKGHIVAVVRGTVNTKSMPCTYLPTAGYIKSK